MMGYFITNLSFNLLVKEFVKIGEHLAKLQAKRLIVLYAPFTLDFCPPKMQNSPDK